jgi:polyhydroxyalkanoate synthesis regulator protein
VLGRYLEQSIMTFREQQELYQRRMREVLNANPLKLVQKMADQNMNFLRSLVQGGDNPDPTGGETTPNDDSKVHNRSSEVHKQDDERPAGDQTDVR